MSAQPPAASVLPAGAKRLPIVGFIAVVVVYLAILQVLGLVLAPSGGTYGKIPDVNTAVRTIILPVGLSVLLCIVVISVLGWWRPVLHDDRPVRRWVWIVPVVMLVAILVGTNYGLISEKGAALFGTLLIGSLLVGIGEELMYRGIGVVAFRSAGFTEGKVALWVAIIFGLSHATNIIAEGLGSLVQVLITVLAGYFFYLARRVSGTILLPMLVHGLWDFGLLTTAAGSTQYLGFAAFLLADIALGIVLLVRRHHIEPPTTVAH